jgi:16S rRNA (adenine1518-N6/adenine1519-N6)-dimethyltransferase
MQIHPKKHLGQNFLTSKDIVKKIVKASGVNETDTVIEIGPGLGILTEELIKHAKKVITIEIDRELVEHLSRKFSTCNTSTTHTNRSLQQQNQSLTCNSRHVTKFQSVKTTKNQSLTCNSRTSTESRRVPLIILNQDALKFDPTSTLKDTPYKVVANIPYYITSPLITHFLTQKNPPISMTLLVQKEVAEKICAQTPSNPKEGHPVLSIMVQLYATPSIKFVVHAGSFTPAPKVESAVIHLMTHKTTYNKEKIIQLAKKTFSGKRKKLSNTLKQEFTILSKTAPAFSKTIKDLRPENLNLEDWEKLAENLPPPH